MSLLPDTNDSGQFEVPDFDGTSGFRLYVPETAFDIQMARHYLQEHVRQWKTVEHGEYTVNVSSYLGDGSFRLILGEPLEFGFASDGLEYFDPSAPVDIDWSDTTALLNNLPKVLEGAVYLTERLFPASEFYRLQGWWALPPQTWQISTQTESNYIEYPPLVKWDDPIFERSTSS